MIIFSRRRAASKRLLGLASAAALFAVTPAGAWAQDAGRGDAAPATSDELGSIPVDVGGPGEPPLQREGAPAELETIIVTATKTARDAQDVPVSLSTVDGDFIRNAGLASFNDLQGYAANTSITVAGSSGTLGVRGFATPDTNPAFDPSVGIVVDGVYYGRSAFLSAFFFDIDRFEVLRGPQGTLFGKNTTAGLINLSTNTARSGADGQLGLLSSSYGRRSLQPAFDAELGGGWDLRLAANGTWGDEGSQYNTALNRDESNPAQRTVRGRLSYAGDGPFTLDLGGFYSHQWRNYNLFAFDHVGPNMLALARQYDPRVDTDPSNRSNSASNQSEDDSELYGGHVTVDYDAGELWKMRRATVTSVTAYAGSTDKENSLDADFSAIPFISDSLVRPSRYYQLSEELRLAGEANDLFGWGYGVNFVTGFFVLGSGYKTSDLFQVQDLGAAYQYITAAQADANGLGAGGGVAGIGGAVGPALSTLLGALQDTPANQDASAFVGLDQKTQSYAYFGQFEHKVLPHWAIIGGLRFGYEHKSADAYSHANSPLIPLITSGAQRDHDTSVSRGEWDLSPKAGLKYEPSRHLNVYFSWAQGYKSGGFNGLPLSDANLEYDSELATSYEVGAKTRFKVYDTPVQFNVAAFSTKFENLQVSTFRGGNFVILNAASARSSGAEGDLTWMPVNGLLLTASAGYADAHYIHYRDAPAISGSGDDTQDLSGRPLQLAPKWTASFLPSWELPLELPLRVILGADVLYRSEAFLDVDDDPGKLQSSNTIYNARLGLATPADGWTVTFGAHNLTRETVYNQALSQPLAPGNTVRWRTDYGRFYTLNLVFKL